MERPVEVGVVGADVHQFVQPRLHLWLQAQPGGRVVGRLPRPPGRGAIEVGQALAGQALSQRRGLQAAVGGQAVVVIVRVGMT